MSKRKKTKIFSDAFPPNELGEKINTLINENDLFERKLKKSNGLLPELNNALKKENLKKSDINIS